MRKTLCILIMLLPVFCISCKSTKLISDNFWSDAELISKQRETITEQSRLIEQLGSELGDLRQSVERAGEINSDLRAWAREHREIEARVVSELRRLEELCRRAVSTDVQAGQGTDGSSDELRPGGSEVE